jgi:modulator of FtsH protease
MNDRYTALRHGGASTVMDGAAHRVLRNTYLLLSMCLGFAAVTAGTSAAFGLPHPGILLTLLGYFGLMFLVTKNRDSGMGVVFLFALTGFMGYTLGPIISMYLKMPNGSQVVMTALGGTAAIFLALSAYALTTKRDLSFMGGFLMVGVLVAFLAGLAALFLNMTALSLSRNCAIPARRESPSPACSGGRGAWRPPRRRSAPGWPTAHGPAPAARPWCRCRDGPAAPAIR